jgi:hypothetical protein
LLSIVYTLIDILLFFKLYLCVFLYYSNANGLHAYIMYTDARGNIYEI